MLNNVSIWHTTGQMIMHTNLPFIAHMYLYTIHVFGHVYICQTCKKSSFNITKVWCISKVTKTCQEEQCFMCTYITTAPQGSSFRHPACIQIAITSLSSFIFTSLDEVHFSAKPQKHARPVSKFNRDKTPNTRTGHHITCFVDFQRVT